MTLTYTPSETLTAFVAYKQGFKSGGFSGSALDSAIGNTTVNDLAFRPESVEGFEGGLRAILADRTVRLALDVYSYKYSNLQIDYFDAAKIQFITKNAASSRAEGVEFEAEWAPPPVRGLTLRGTLNYNRARYLSFADAPCYGARPAEAARSWAPGHAGPAATHSLAPTDQRAGSQLPARRGREPVFGRPEPKFQQLLRQPLAIRGQQGLRHLTVRASDQEPRWEVADRQNLTDEYVLTTSATRPAAAPHGLRPVCIPTSAGTPSLPRTVAVQLTFKY